MTRYAHSGWPPAEPMELKCSPFCCQVCCGRWIAANTYPTCAGGEGEAQPCRFQPPQIISACIFKFLHDTLTTTMGRSIFMASLWPNEPQGDCRTRLKMPPLLSMSLHGPGPPKNPKSGCFKSILKPTDFVLQRLGLKW